MSNAIHSPAPWTYENVHQCSERTAYGVVKDANDRILFDTANSDVTEINTEYDEGSVHRWDEMGRLNLTLAAAAPDLLAACRIALRTLSIAQENVVNIGGQDCAEARWFEEPLKEIAAALAKSRGEQT